MEVVVIHQLLHSGHFQLHFAKVLLQDFVKPLVEVFLESVGLLLHHSVQQHLIGLQLQFAHQNPQQLLDFHHEHMMLDPHLDSCKQSLLVVLFILHFFVLIVESFELVSEG